MSWALITDADGDGKYGHCPPVDGAEAYCQPMADCAVWFDVVTTTCQLPYEAVGACCPRLPYNSTITQSLL